MLRTATFQPEWISCPGETLAQLVEARGYSSRQFSEILDCDIEFLEALYQGLVELDNEMAVQLEEALGISREFWIQRERQYGATRDSRKKFKAISESDLVDGLPFASLRRLGWLECGRDANSRLKAALDFFSVSDTDEYSAKYSDQLSAVAFRESMAFDSQPLSVLAWLRKGEIEAAKLTCAIWNREVFIDRLSDIRKLTRVKDPQEFLPKLTQICSDCGVALVLVAPPEGCRASGATKFLSPSKAMIIMSLRYKSDDHFWFTFYHEAAHLVLHSDDALFLEDDSEATADEEQEANDFAREFLVPRSFWDRIPDSNLSFKTVIGLAYEIGVSPGILVGQLQHAKMLPHNKMNFLKRRYSWGSDGKPSLIP